jgi:hypothetical protein
MQEIVEKGQRVTIDDIESAIVEEMDYKIGNKTTAVVLVLRNGFEVTGIASCVDPAAYDQAIGRKYARVKAIDQMWQLMGFVAQEKIVAESNLAGS